MNNYKKLIHVEIVGITALKNGYQGQPRYEVTLHDDNHLQVYITRNKSGASVGYRIAARWLFMYVDANIHYTKRGWVLDDITNIYYE